MELTAETLKEDLQPDEPIGNLEGSVDGEFMPCLLESDREYFLEISEKFDLVMEWAKGLVIIDDTSLARATDIVAVLKIGDKNLEARSVELRAPLRARETEIRNAFKAIQSKIDSTLQILTGQMRRYHDEVERLRTAALEEAKRIEAEALKREQEAAVKAAARSGNEEDVAKVESLAERQDALEKADTTPVKAVSRGQHGMSGISKIADREKIQKAVDAGVKIPGVRAWQEWHFEITEARLIPDEYRKSSLYTRT